MAISVIISVYKTEEPKYFEKALRSVWDDQTRKPEQIVLVEDGPLQRRLGEDVRLLLGLLRRDRGRGRRAAAAALG